MEINFESLEVREEVLEGGEVVKSETVDHDPEDHSFQNPNNSRKVSLRLFRV